MSKDLSPQLNGDDDAIKGIKTFLCAIPIARHTDRVMTHPHRQQQNGESNPPKVRQRARRLAIPHHHPPPHNRGNLGQLRRKLAIQPKCSANSHATTTAREYDGAIQPLRARSLWRKQGSIDKLLLSQCASPMQHTLIGGQRKMADAAMISYRAAVVQLDRTDAS